jgi:hypothetical protein
MVGALFSPNDTFASIARKPDWVVPLVVLLIIACLSGLVMATRVDFAAPAREAMAQNKNATPEQAEQAERFGAAIGKVLSYASPVFAAIIYVLIAAVLLLAFRLFGGEVTFKQAFSVTLYAWMPEVIKAVATLGIMLAKAGTYSPVELPVIVRSNPAFLVDMKLHPVLFALLTNVEFFGIWTLVLFIIGFAYAAKVSKAKSAVIVISIRVVVALFGLIGPALQSLRK